MRISDWSSDVCSSDLLSQDEIDALLHGVDSGKVDTTPAPAAPGEARSFDFTSQDRIVRGRMPTLEMVNERFARLFRISLFNMLRRSLELTVELGRASCRERVCQYV